MFVFYCFLWRFEVRCVLVFADGWGLRRLAVLRAQEEWVAAGCNQSEFMRHGVYLVERKYKSQKRWVFLKMGSFF
jgi:hypothetical protein